MKTIDEAARQFVLQLLHEVHDMTLATVRPDGYPQATTVSYGHRGLVLYAGIGLDGQKARNIQLNAKVSAAITAPYADWDHIRGLSMAATATLVSGVDDVAEAAECLLRRFPQLRQAHGGAAPWGGALFVRIVPQIISVLDYSKGFGHTDLYAIDAAALTQAD